MIGRIASAATSAGGEGGGAEGVGGAEFVGAGGSHTKH